MSHRKRGSKGDYRGKSTRLAYELGAPNGRAIPADGGRTSWWSFSAEDGPGILILDSANVFTEWTVSEMQQDVIFEQRCRTGPAAARAFYIRSGCTVQATIKYKTVTADGAVDQFNGLIDTAADPTLNNRQRVRARFLPDVQMAEVMEANTTAHGLFVTGGGFTPAPDRASIPAGVFTRLAYPPRFCTAVKIHTASAMTGNDSWRISVLPSGNVLSVVSQELDTLIAPWHSIGGFKKEGAVPGSYTFYRRGD